MIIFHFRENRKSWVFIGFIFWAFWTYFRQFFGHIRGSCRPAKGPKIFINCILSHDYILYAGKSQKLNFHWIYSIKITFLSYTDPFQAVFRYIWGSYRPAKGPQDFQQLYFITLLHLIFMKITKVGFSLDLFHKNHFFELFGPISGSFLGI